MKSILNSTSFSSIFPPLPNQVKDEKILYWLTITVSLLASLEFGQDYIKSVLNNSDYSSLLLHIISFTINDQPWPLAILLTQKLSTRLYLGLSFYIIFSFIYHHFGQKTIKSIDQKSNINTFRIKHGSKTTFIETQKINFIVSDGPYLEVSTLENKHVILDSLKNIIESLPENFKRIHKSTIVNTDQIESSKSRGNGDHDLVLKCGKTVRLSRNYAKPLKGILH